MNDEVFFSFKTTGKEKNKQVFTVLFVCRVPVPYPGSCMTFHDHVHAPFTPTATPEHLHTIPPTAPHGVPPFGR